LTCWLAFVDIVVDEVKSETGGRKQSVAHGHFPFQTARCISHFLHFVCLQCEMGPMPPPSKFKPLKCGTRSPSSNPKTVLNRQYYSQKRGLDIALHRVDANFRVNKSRAFKKLASHPSWAHLPEKEQKARQDAIVAELTRVRQQKREEAEREWYDKVEADDVHEDEDYTTVMDGIEDEEVIDSDEKDRMEQGDAGSWQDDDEEGWEDVDDEKWNGSDEEKLGAKATNAKLGKDMVDKVMGIKALSGLGWLGKLERLEAEALDKSIGRVHTPHK
jgi:hypothetical protein